MEQFAISTNFESAAARGNQRKRFDALAELKNFGRQTDGLRRVVSNDAIFDRHFGFHRQSPFRNETIGVMKQGQEMSREAAAFTRDTEPSEAWCLTQSPQLRKCSRSPLHRAAALHFSNRGN